MHLTGKKIVNNALISREAQKVLAEERRDKERVETELQETQAKVRSLELVRKPEIQ